MKRSFNHAMEAVIKERINGSQQARRYAKLMQQTYLAAMGEITLTREQSEAARTFMLGWKSIVGRYVPELKSVEVSGAIDHNHASEMTEEQLERIAATSSSGVVESSARTTLNS